MKVLRVLAVDDELLARQRVEQAVASLADVELVGLARDGREGLALVRALKPDVLLLDIEMAAFGGFELVEALNGPDAPLVIFVTAHEGFALKAFEVAAVDYVLKPVAAPRLGAALERARERLAARDGRRAFVEDLWVERKGELIRLPVGRLEWLQADRDYVRLHLADGQHLIRGPLAELHARLDPAEFIRVHRSTVVRVKAIRTIRRSGPEACFLGLASGAELRVGKTYLHTLREIRREFDA